MCSEFHYTMYFSEVAHHMADCQSWCRSDPLIFYFSLALPLFCIGTFSVDILVWGRPHKYVMKIGLFACLISANQSFAWPRQQLIIFMVWESIVHNCVCHKSLFHSHFPVGGWWHYWNHTTLSELIIGDNVIKIVGLDMLWHYKIKNTNSMEGHVVGIFIFGFLISETAQCPTWQ